MNLFDITGTESEIEVFEPIADSGKVLIERIVSRGHASPQDFWYDQERDEWVALLQGRACLSWEDGRVLDMEAGDWVLIKAHERHRVERTSNDPACIWLAIHGSLCRGDGSGKSGF